MHCSRGIIRKFGRHGRRPACVLLKSPGSSSQYRERVAEAVCMPFHCSPMSQNAVAEKYMSSNTRSRTIILYTWIRVTNCTGNMNLIGRLTHHRLHSPHNWMDCQFGSVYLSPIQAGSQGSWSISMDSYSIAGVVIIAPLSELTTQHFGIVME